jgi:hypothetical protein
MTDSPLATLARLGGGVTLLAGPLGHQALGQILISQSNLVEVAGANVALAAVTRHSSLAVQLAVNTVVPALVIEALSRQEDRRLARERERLEQLAQVQGGSAAHGLIALESILPEEVVMALATNAQRRVQREGQS